MKFIVVSGGVLSGLGKGITAASIGLLLKSRGIKVTTLKCDMYLNIDAGTMNPVEHGEVFVTHDGLETDQDLGHYERFLGHNHLKVNYMTNGQIYKIVLDKERALEYEGVCVQPYHHLPPEIIERWHSAGRAHKADIVIVELGGTVGEYEGLLFFESVRRLKLKKPKDVLLIHVGYLPAPKSIGELKSKPLQQSISQLNSLGLHPDLIVGRAELPIDNKRKEKIALASGLNTEDIISAPDVESIYEVPLILYDQDLDQKILKKLGLKHLKQKKSNLTEWKKMYKKFKNAKKEIKIAIVGKYQKTGDYTLEDSYVCVVEAIKHAAWEFGLNPKLVWIDSEKITDDLKAIKLLSEVDAIIVPQGWGSRGIEGKILAAKYARENNVPYLGLCFGMQMATIEYGRNVVGLKNANTQEVNEKALHKVIHIMPHQKKYLDNKIYGGTIRLGAWPCKIKKGSILENAYKKYGQGKDKPWNQPNSNVSYKETKSNGDLIVHERHRHRYEFNNKYKKDFKKNGFVISGESPDGKLVEAIEIKDHPFYVGTQFHPEYLSRPLAPHPIFLGFVEAIIENVRKN